MPADPSIRSRRPGGIPVPLLFLASGISQYLGAALAVSLFTVVTAAGIAWWRIAASAVVLLAWRRPWRSRWTRRELLHSAVFGVVLATMNVSFYIAIDHLPLGTAVAIEFLGPVAVAAITGSGWRDRVAIVLAAGGVVLLSIVELGTGESGTVVGLIAIGISGLTWAGYILLGRRIAARRDGISSLAVGMTAGALFYLPLGVTVITPVVTDLGRLAAVLGIAVLSSVVPYALEQVVLRRVTAARFAILLALLPVTAALVGAVVLTQVPTPAELAGIALVCTAIVLSADRPPPQDAASLPATS